jgi:hypothetical protein
MPGPQGWTSNCLHNLSLLDSHGASAMQLLCMTKCSAVSCKGARSSWKIALLCAKDASIVQALQGGAVTRCHPKYTDRSDTREQQRRKVNYMVGANMFGILIAFCILDVTLQTLRMPQSDLAAPS